MGYRVRPYFKIYFIYEVLIYYLFVRIAIYMKVWSSKVSVINHCAQIRPLFLTLLPCLSLPGQC